MLYSHHDQSPVLETNSLIFGGAASTLEKSFDVGVTAEVDGRRGAFRGSQNGSNGSDDIRLSLKLLEQRFHDVFVSYTS